MEKGRLFIQIQSSEEAGNCIKLFSRDYDYKDLLSKVDTAYREMSAGDLNHFSFEDKKGCTHFLGDSAFRNAHIWVQKVLDD